MIKKFFHWMLTLSMSAQVVNCELNKSSNSGNFDNCNDIQESRRWNNNYICEDVGADYYYGTDFQTRRGDGYTVCGVEGELYCCCQESSSSAECGLDITEEQEGVDIIVDELSNNGLVTERNDGSWFITIYNFQTRTDIETIPDVISHYSEGEKYYFFEFSSSNNPGVGFSDERRLYFEITPQCESNLRTEVRNNLQSSNSRE